MSLKNINEGFNRLFNDILKTPKSNVNIAGKTTAEELKTALNSTLNSLQEKCVTDLNQYETSFKRVLEQKFPDNQWWEVTNCDIKWSLFNNKSPKQTVKEIVEGLNIKEGTSSNSKIFRDKDNYAFMKGEIIDSPWSKATHYIEYTFNSNGDTVVSNVFLSQQDYDRLLRELSNGARDDIKITKHDVADKKLDKWVEQPITVKNESLKNRSRKIKESNSHRIRKPLKEGTGNFFFENRCVVVTDEDYENGNYPKYEKKPLDPYARNHPQYPLIDYNDGLNCYRIVLTTGYYEAACIDYVEIEYDELRDDFWYICENELPNIDYDIEEKTWYKSWHKDDDDTSITLEEAVDIIYSAFYDYPATKREDIKKVLLTYKEQNGEKHISEFLLDSDLVDKIEEHYRNEEEPEVNRRIDEIKKEYGFSNGETGYNIIKESHKKHESTNINKHTRSTGEGNTHFDFDDLIGMDIFDVREKLGYWWILDSQHVTSQGGTYNLVNGVKSIVIETDAHNVVKNVRTSKGRWDIKESHKKHESTNINKHTRSTGEGNTHFDFDDLIGMDIFDVREKLGYWWILDSQHVTSQGGTYNLVNGVKSIVIETDAHNVVKNVRTSKGRWDIKESYNNNHEIYKKYIPKGFIMYDKQTSNPYIATTRIFNQDYTFEAIIEYHSYDVKTPYFVAWKAHNPKGNKYNKKWETKDFYTIEDVMKFLFSGEYSEIKTEGYRKKYIRESFKTPKKRIKESYNGEMQVFMNTWANYNENGADEGITPTGWMSIEDALEYCEKYAENEPFINDTENTPFDISENDSATEILELLQEIESSVDENEYDLFNAILEYGGYANKFDAVENAIEVIKNGDYMWFPNVSTDEELGYAYVESIGSLGDALGDRINYYIDEEQMRRDYEGDIRNNLYEDAKESVENEHYGEADESELDILEDGMVVPIDELVYTDRPYTKEDLEEGISEYLSDWLYDKDLDDYVTENTPKSFEFEVDGDDVRIYNIDWGIESYDKDEAIEEYVDEHLDSYLDSIIEEELALAEKGEIDLSNYFDYEKYGRDLRFEGFAFEDGGALLLH